MRCIILCLCLPVLAWGTVHDVFENGGIQQAVLLAAEGDTVLIHDGVYQETTVLYGKILTIGSRFLLDGDTSHITATVIEPDFTRPDTQSCFVYAYDEQEGGRLVGLTMRNGMGTIWNSEYTCGGAVYVLRAHVVIENCRLDNCFAELGGGVFLQGRVSAVQGSADLRNLLIENCFANSYGGGIYADRSNLDVAGSVIRDCDAGVSAGGITITDSRARIENVEIRNCIGRITGGLEYLGTTGFIRGCLFEGNGGGDDYTIADLNLSNGNVEVSGCIFRNNAPSGCSIVEFSTTAYPLRFFGNLVEGNMTTSGLTGTFFLANNSRGEIAYSIFRNNDNWIGGAIYGITGTRVRVHHCVFERNITRRSTSASAVMLDENSPMVVDSNIFIGNSGTTVSHLNTYETAPIHAENNWWGDASGPYHPTLNPTGRGDTLLQDSIYFIPWLTEPPDTTMPESYVRERPEAASTWRLMAVYPNPFNSSVRLILAGFSGKGFSVTLHNLLGQEVAVLHRGPLTGGEIVYSAPSGLSSGVYFLRAADRTSAETRKVVLLR